jgi:hypothetical protein
MGALAAAIVPAFAAGLAIERGFQFPYRRIGRMLEGAQCDQRNTVAAVALGLKEIITAIYPVAYLSSGLFEDPLSGSENARLRHISGWLRLRRPAKAGFRYPYPREVTGQGRTGLSAE